MNKKAWYWALGGLAVIILIIIIAVAMPSKNATEPPNTNTNHSNMDHSATPDTSSKDTELNRYLEEQDTIMSEMIDAMASIEHSGNAAIDFLVGMLPHHQSAIAMAESYLQYGGEAFKQLAQDIIATQTEEIKQMNTLIQDLKTQGKQDEEQEKSYLAAYDALFANHEHSAVNTTAMNIEIAFAEGMAMHHQMAVDMAEAILQNTEEEKVITFAQNIVDTQEKEIAEMQSYLNEQAST